MSIANLYNYIKVNINISEEEDHIPKTSSIHMMWMQGRAQSPYFEVTQQCCND